ncbi:MAG: hypothetical protein ACRELD_10850, partial [Longimicrobiales bacterium]
AAPAAPVVRLAIPAELQALKQADPALALAWREASRTALLDLFARGYAATDMVRDGAVSWYLLEPADDIDLGDA